MAAGIASGFVRKLYRILDHESADIVSWDASGASFSIHDSDQLNDVILPRYFRGRLVAFRQQLIDHGFEQLEVEDDESRESYRHPHFIRGCPGQLSYIVRVPKGKKKTANVASLSAPPSLSVHIAPSSNPPRVRTPLTVTLNGGKRPSPNHGSSGDVGDLQKRLRTIPLQSPTTASSHQPTKTLLTAPKLTSTASTPVRSTNIGRNPLFSNDPDPGFDVARVFSLGRMSDTGLLPCSTDLPEPISYLNRSTSTQLSGSTSSIGAVATQSSTSTVPSIDAIMFSEDTVKSALYFLVSTSTTGTGVESNGNAAPAAPVGKMSSNDHNSLMAKAERLSTSGFLSSLLVSSTTTKNGLIGGVSASSATSAAPPGWSNPLFSDKSSADDEEEDSIWSLLVASSIDRVKSTITDLTDPQEKLRLILEERERLEEQRKKIFGETNESTTILPSVSKKLVKVEANTPNPLFSSGARNPLFTKSTDEIVLPSSTSKPLFTQDAAPANPLFTKDPTSINTLFANDPAPSNPLFTKDPVPSNPLFTKEATASNPLFANETSPSNPLFSKSNESSNPLFAKSTESSNPLFSKAPQSSNPLFSKDTESSNPLFAKTADSSNPLFSKAKNTVNFEKPNASNSVATNEDGLWRLLMSSSVDWLRKSAAELEM
ncbi:hypothetical protein Poli38472_008300 [Pythium oligandrum]|uniref:HSF-type DNA-binding domain-containing protein n=1 Tax=Pythium oligandrum TaxID=41045 RepID=A0A8K1CMJ8_PYTOL|nr:hypothetical protein Poli38472_008300 [Pythium oligandrum]|eukprot:TMW65658.1 hypothetical protein Poli38472_008300 [Pythium oligandrum]